MCHNNPRFWDQFLEMRSHCANGLHPVVYKENLPTALELTQDRLAYQPW
jgi:hypothetical protein